MTPTAPVTIGTPLSPHATRVLLLGSGELGKEVAIELQRFGVEVIAADRYADAPAMQVALPKARTAAPAEDDPARLVLAIDAAGQVRHGGDMVGSGDWPGLLAAHPEGAVELRVDRAAPFDAFIGAMDPLREAGRNDVLITAKPE